MKKNRKILIIISILIIIAIIIMLLIYNNKKNSNEYSNSVLNSNSEEYSNFTLDSDSKYILTTNAKILTMQNDGGSHMNDYYQIDFDNNQVTKCEDKYVGFKGYEYKGKFIYTKNLSENEISELKSLIDEIITKKDDEQTPSTFNYNYYTLSTKDYKEIRIYDESIINKLESILSLSSQENNETQENTSKDNENGFINNDWKKINIENYKYNESTTVELDLDGDNIKEKVGINETGKYISINDTDYIVNKYLNDDDTTGFNDYNVNQYYIVDLNSDGILEIIHRTFSNMISPITSEYTIYNYINNKLKEIGNLSIMGNIPNEIYVKENRIKFEYWPYESPQDNTKEVIYELDI